MKTKELKVLLIEDNPGDVRLIREMLPSENSHRIDLSVATKLQTGLKLLQEKEINIILLDLGLPDSQGLTTLEKAQAVVDSIPIVVLTGLEDEEIGVQAIRQGAQDYLVKGQVNDVLLARYIHYAIERCKVERKLRESEEKYRDLAESAKDVLLEIDLEGNFLYMSKSIEDKTGYTREEIVKKNMEELLTEKSLKKSKAITKKWRQGAESMPPYEIELIAKDGRNIPFELNTSPVCRDGGVKYISIVARDITARKRAEKKLQHRARFEKLLRQLSTSFLELGIKRKDRVIDEALAKVGNFLEVDRSYVFIFDNQQNTLSNTNEWCADGIEPQKNNLQNLPVSSTPAWMEKLQNFEKISIESVSELPESWSAEREILETQDIQSVAATPISHEGKLRGFVGFDTVKKKRDWEEDIYLLAVLGDLLSHLFYWRRAVKQIQKDQNELRDSFVQLAETTSRVLGVRDPYTQEHEQRVGELAKEVGKKMGLSKDRLLGLYLGGLLHDIGKIIIPETILTKPGKLKKVEWQMIKSHPEIGYHQILKDTDFPWPVADMTLHHHERLDGSGYPDGLEGDELTTEVRILGAVDVIEAMSTMRPYRSPRTKEETLKEIKTGKGMKYDPEVVDILVEMIEEREIEFGGSGQ